MRKSLSKIKNLDQLDTELRRLRSEGSRIVFTNGCFDLLHAGHVRYLCRARARGDVLVVAVNSDRTVRELKGSGRPVVTELERAEVLGALQCVDFVTIFDDLTPLEVIRRLQPAVLVKGGDWPIDQIVGRDIVASSGGEVVSLPFEEGFSSTSILKRIREEG